PPAPCRPATPPPWPRRPPPSWSCRRPPTRRRWRSPWPPAGARATSPARRWRVVEALVTQFRAERFGHLAGGAEAVGAHEEVRHVEERDRWVDRAAQAIDVAGARAPHGDGQPGRLHHRLDGPIGLLAKGTNRRRLAQLLEHLFLLATEQLREHPVDDDGREGDVG